MKTHPFPSAYIDLDGSMTLSFSADLTGINAHVGTSADINTGVTAGNSLFSFGPYNCVGKNLAMHEMRMMLCYTLQNLDISFEKDWDESVWEKELEDIFVIAKGKLPVTVTPRNSK